MSDPIAPRRAARVFLWLAAALLAIVALLVAWEIRGPLVMALVLAYLMQPLHRRFAPRVRWRWISGLLLTLMVVVLLVLPLAILAIALAEDVRRLAEVAMRPGGPERLLDDLLGALGIDAGAADAVIAEAGASMGSLVERMLLPALTTSVTFALSLVIFLLLLYFLIVDWERLATFVRGVVPLDRSEHDVLFARAGERVKALVLGSLLVAVVQAVVAGLGWWLLGLPSPVFFGFLMLVLEIVPVLGAFVVLLPATVWAFATGQMVAGVGLLVLNFIAVGLIDDLLRAWVVGRWTGIHPALVLVGLAGGIPIFGLSGIVLGPLLVSMFPLFLEAVAGKGPTRLQEPPSQE